MDLIQWTDEMSVKIEKIDEQHKYLIKLINQLFEAMIEGEAYKILNDIINKLIEYSEYHFNEEENLLEKNGYSESEAHKLTHKYFIDEINNFKNEIADGKTTLSIEVFNFLKDWLTDHILKTDQKYSRFLVKKGVK